MFACVIFQTTELGIFVSLLFFPQLFSSYFFNDGNFLGSSTSAIAFASDRDTTQSLQVLLFLVVKMTQLYVRL